MEDMIDTIYNTKRTVRIHIGLGSLHSNDYRLFDYASNLVINYNDKNYTHYSDAHP